MTLEKFYVGKSKGEEAMSFEVLEAKVAELKGAK